MKHCTLYLALLAAMVAGSNVYAQKLIEQQPGKPEGKKMEIRHLMNPNLYAKRPDQLKWTNNPILSAVVYTKGDSIFRWSQKNGEELVSTLERMNKDATITSHGSLLTMPKLLQIEQGKTYIKSRNACYLYNSISKMTEKVCSVDVAAENFDISPASDYIAYTKQNNLLFIRNGIKFAVSHDYDTGIVNGRAVHRDEFGITKGTFWSSDGKRLAYYRMDESMVKRYPLADYTNDTLRVVPTRYPEAGTALHRVTVRVFNTETFQTVELEPYADPSRTYITSVTWCPDDEHIFLGLLDRNQKDFTLVRYFSETGKIDKVLFKEHNDKYVEPESGIFLRPKHNEEFVWMSERSGFNHLYLYNVDGRLIKPLTPEKEPWMVTEFNGFSKDGKRAYFTATKDGPLQQNLYGIDVDRGKIWRITKEDGIHRTIRDRSGDMDENSDYFIDYYSAPGISCRTQIIDNKGKVIKVLMDEGDHLAEYVRPEYRLYTLKAADGKTDLYARMILPPDFDPNKRYPVLIYVYGGPHAQLVNQSYDYGSGIFLRFLAQEGYIVWTLDNRGSANRGFEFESAIHRRIGEVEAADQLEGLKFLTTLPYVDANRIGIDGWSYGGFMALNMRTLYPQLFRVTTAGGPVINWAWYEIMYGERYMGTPQDNPEGYKKANLLNRVDRIDYPNHRVMLLQGGLDPTVLPKNAATFVQRCIEKNIPIDYFVYHNHPHNVRGAQRDHLYQKLFRYYEQNLK